MLLINMIICLYCDFGLNLELRDDSTDGRGDHNTSKNMSELIS